MNIIEETKPLVDKVIEKVFIRSFKKFMNFDNQITLISMDGFSEYLLDIYRFKHSSDIHNLICSLEAFIDIYHVREEKILRVLNRLLKNLLKYHKCNLGKSINILLKGRLKDFIKDLDVEILA